MPNVNRDTCHLSLIKQFFDKLSYMVEQNDALIKAKFTQAKISDLPKKLLG